MKNNRPHLLLICPFASPNIGGVESHLDKLIKYALSNNFYVTLLTYQPLTRRIKAPKEEHSENLEIYRISWFGIGLFPKIENYFPLVFIYLFPGLFIGALHYLLKNHKSVDVIHAHGLVAACITKLCNFFFKKRTIVSTHAVYSFENRALLSILTKWILISFDVILAVSKVSRQELIRMGLFETKIKVHPNWIDTTVFSPEATKPTQMPKSFNVLFVGRLLEKKGILLFLEAAKKMPSVGFHIVGDGPELQAVTEAKTACSNIYYYGVLMQSDQQQLADLVSLYANCDYLISPYTYDEGFSTTLIEALACGTPLIITDRGSPPTFITNKVAHFLPANFTLHDLVKIIEQVATFPKKELSKACRNYSINNFGFKNADIILESYSQKS